MDDKLIAKSKELYDAINRYYTLLIDSITLEDYESIKGMLGYTDEYEDHINNIRSHIKPEDDTISEIKKFLTTYTEFERKHYTNMIHHVCEEIEKNPQKFKQEAYKGILKFVEEINTYEDSEECLSDENDLDENNIVEGDNVGDNVGDNIMQNEESDEESEEHVFYIGNTEIVIKTYGDPLLRNLYNVLFMIFETENGF